MSSPALHFIAEGLPVSKGSKRLVSRGQKTWMIDSASHRLKEWEAAIHEACRLAMVPTGWQTIPEGIPVAVRLAFTYPTPKAMEASIRRDASMPWPVAKGVDIDKAARAVLDALSGRAFHDDRQVARLAAMKSYAGSMGALKVPGVEVLVKAWAP